ncbi:acyl-CoA thioesterase [Hyalangium gracile]|uniref:acyl-CoA thioesterase n=1 Tax=Hyalangium gracile TaxID=394092 RepID=UPI001CCF3057|nr:thioesterase family protein [Hyalangium gracile]
MTLTALLSPERRGERDFLLQVPDGWQQGRGLFGGVVFGVLVNAMRACEPDAGRALRSLTAEIPAPVLVGEAEIQVRALRIGNAVSTWTATLTQRGEACARATGVFGGARVADRTWWPEPPPRLRDWEAVEVMPVEPPFGPVFAQHFEYRNVGPWPFSQGNEPSAAGWLRPRLSPDTITPAEIVACVDAWWPAAFATETGPRPMATVSSTIQLYSHAAPVDTAAPFFHRARAVAAQDGFILETRELWSLAGELLATNQQTFVIIK